VTSLAAPFLTAIDGVASSGALDSRVSSSSFYFFSPFFSFSDSNSWWQRIWGKRIPRAAAAQGIGAAGAWLVLKGGDALDARAELPRGHPWRPSHGGDVAAILWPAPKVRGRGCRAKGSNPPLEEHPRPELGCPHGSACVPVEAPRAPVCGACIGVYGRRKKGKQRPADVWTPPCGESKEERCELGLAGLRNWFAGCPWRFREGGLAWLAM
jgi:hypothetical protein